MLFVAPIACRRPPPPAPTAAESRAPELLQKYSQKKTNFTQKTREEGAKKKSIKNQKKKLRFGRPTNEAMESKASKTAELQILAIHDFLARDGHGPALLGGGVGGRRRGNEDAEENEKEGDGGGGTYFL
jgi:hypothetical protein